MQKSTPTFLFLIILYILALQKVECGSSSPVWVASSYFKAGAISFTFTSGAIIQNATVTYSSTIVNSNLKVPTLGITDIDFTISAGKIYLLIKVVQYTATLMKFQVQVATNSALSLLKMTYMALDNSFTPAFSMNYFFPTINQNGTGITAQFYVNFTASTGVTLNTTHENVLLPFMHYIDVITYDNTIDINLSFTVLNASFYTVIISSTSKIYFQYAGFSRLIFDKTAIEAMGNDYFNYGMISSTNNNNAALSTIIPPSIIPSNLYYGIHSFTITTGISKLSFTSAYVINSGVIGYTSQSTYVYSKMKFSYIHHKTRTCPAAYPFYNIALVMCYDICPTRWYGNVSTSTCQQCLYDCYTCTDSSTCSSCSSATDHRTLSGSRCVPISGYFDTNTSTTVASGCTSPCVTCQNSASACLTCISGYYASNYVCLTCVAALPYCMACNSSNFCTQCNDGTSGSSCSSCTNGQYLQASNNTCIDCSGVIQLCVSCTAVNVCTLCQDTFTLFGPTNCSCQGFEYRFQTEGSLDCFSCADTIPYCFSCTSSTDCTACYSTFILAADGSSCTCDANSFINTSSLCQPCSTAINYCTTCTSSSLCTLCLATFTIVNGTCQCSSGFYFDSNSTSCLSCPTAISQCITCSSSSVCLTCDSGYQLNTTTHICDLILCIISNCYACITGNYTICQYCNTGYSLSTTNTSCHVVCGDYQLNTPTEQCDDGNILSGDGCSSTCQIETGFSCPSQYVNITQTYSICFYSSTVSFDLLWTRKIEGSNKLKFLFQLNQQISQWKTVDFTGISSIDFVDSSTNFTLGMTQDFVQSCSATYDSSTNRFSLTINYFNYSLQKQWVSVALSPYSMGYPTFTPPSNVEFFPPSISLIFPVLADNNQNSNVYSAAEYGLYNANLVITYAVLSLAVFTIATSLIFRKGTLLTFEMLTIIQISYFSVAFLDSMNPIFAGMLPLRFLTGILNFQFIENYLYEFSSVDAMKGIYIYLNLSSNFNIVALVLAIFLALGFVLLLLHFIVSYFGKSKDKSKAVQPGGYWMQRVAYHFIGELSIALVLAWLPLYTISLFFELLYTKNSSNFWSYALALGVGIAIVAYFIALIKTPYLKQGEFSRLGEYISEFNSVSSLFATFKYPNLQILQTSLISALVMICIYGNIKLFCTMCIIFICFVDIVLVAIVQPYRYGFVSCFRGEDNDTEVLFQKIELYKVYEKELPPIQTDVAEMSRKGDLEENASEVFTQHFVTRKNVIKTKHQGLIKAGEVLNRSRLILFNNNFRRIINMATLILVQFVFVCAKLFETQINQSSDTVNIKMLLPLFIHMFLFINMGYNYTFLVLQILNRTKENMNLNRVEQNPDSSSQFMKSIYTTNAIKKQEAVEAQESVAAAPIKTHHEITQENATAKSMYSLKRPQILHPTRKTGVKRTAKKIEETQ